VTLKLAQYDLLLLPSYREGYPGIIIEALSVGIPVVSTRVGGIPEIIECEHNGLLVECHQPVELAKAIRAFETIDYTAYCNNAYQTFQEHFESDRTNEHILSLLTTN
jgi:glycosyltransferase involved in cell wall biosynthesis